MVAVAAVVVVVDLVGWWMVVVKTAATATALAADWFAGVSLADSLRSWRAENSPMKVPWGRLPTVEPAEDCSIGCTG